MTFMNRSGDAALWLLAELEITAERMLVVVDDVDLPLGALRLRRSGGPGTHNGLRDLCAKIGDGFPRLRVGVRGDSLSGDLANYVTSPFASSETEIADAAIERAVDAVDAALRDSFEKAMNVFNRPPSTTQF
jgi:PTH1 family peptidyl-tRNA hydrolase